MMQLQELKLLYPFVKKLHVLSVMELELIKVRHFTDVISVMEVDRQLRIKASFLLLKHVPPVRVKEM
jgi:hypothetical protein